MSDVTIGAFSWELGSYAPPVEELFLQWEKDGTVEHLWNRDASVWTQSDEADWLGWLSIVTKQQAAVSEIAGIAQAAHEGGFDRVMLLGMGGSSLGPEVLRRTLGVQAPGIELLVLDSTVPPQVMTFANSINIEKTLFLVASKSGGTTEPNAFKQFFYERVVAAVGVQHAGSHFMAITDPGTKLDALAKNENFRATAHGDPTIGGRYSVLSAFGMVPVAMLGVDAGEFLRRTEAMVQACGAAVPIRENPGVALGFILGSLGQQGRDKVTFITSPGMESLGAWLEQLIAESSGKQGKGLVPIDAEDIAPPAAYGSDRVFVCITLANEVDAQQEERIAVLQETGSPIVRIVVPDANALGQEFFRWEIATAVACAVLGVNAFNQPDVEASKIATSRLTDEFEQSGVLPEEHPTMQDQGLAIFAAGETAKHLQRATNLQEALRMHLGTLTAGDYFAINAYVEMDDAHRELLQKMRHRVRDVYHVATTLGFGPRFLHSTGQLHKGGPNTGVFLQLTAGEPQRVAVPAQKYSFGELVRFQAQGDLTVLIDRKRRALRIHLGDDSLAGLRTLNAAIDDVTRTH